MGNALRKLYDKQLQPLCPVVQLHEANVELKAVSDSVIGDNESFEQGTFVGPLEFDQLNELYSLIIAVGILVCGIVYTAVFFALN